MNDSGQETAIQKQSVPQGRPMYPAEPAATRRSPWRMAAAACIVLACASLVLGMFAAFLTDKNAAERDFIEYWASGQQLVHSANPYDPDSLLALERRAGLEDREPRVSLSPPLVLFLTIPLGFVGPKAGLILWLIVLNGALAASIWILWILRGRPQNGLQFCGFLFAPAVACLMAGQLGLFLLLGVVLFLYFKEVRPLLAGAALLPCAFKPHLFLPFSIALLLWMVERRRFRVLLGFLGMVLISCGLALSFDPHVFSQYLGMMSDVRVMHAFVPTLSVAFRFLVDRKAVWLQFVPEAVACVWAIWFYAKRHDGWSWTSEGMLLLLVSAMSAPYAWFSDEALLLAPMLLGVFRAADRGRSLLPIAVVASIALIEVLSVGHMESLYYLWTMPAWLACYIYATGTGKRQPNEVGGVTTILTE